MGPHGRNGLCDVCWSDRYCFRLVSLVSIPADASLWLLVRVEEECHIEVRLTKPTKPIRIETTAAVVSIRCSRSPVCGSSVRGIWGMLRNGWGGSERYDDGGDLGGRLGMRGPGVKELFARIRPVGPAAAEPTWASRWPWRRVTDTPRPYRPVRVAGRVGARAPRCRRSARDARGQRTRRADQGPAGTALRRDDSPAR